VSPHSKSLVASVVVPVYRDWSALRQCIAALRAQTLPIEQFEIIVVSNDPNDNGAEAIKDIDPPSNLILLHEPRGYSYAARNAAIAQARGQVLAFTDADCRPAADWLACGVADIARQNVEVLGGRVEMTRSHERIAEVYDCVFGLTQEIYLRRYGAMATANLFVHKSAFARAGLFDERLQSNGDFEFCRRAVGASCSLGYSGTALVRHPARATLRALIMQSRRMAIGASDAWALKVHNADKSFFAFWLPAWRPRWRGWLRILGGTDPRVAGLSLPQRGAVAFLRMALYYHRAMWIGRARLRGVARKDCH